MKIIKIDEDIKNKNIYPQKNNLVSLINKFNSRNCHSLSLGIIFILIIYLLIQNNKISFLYQEIAYVNEIFKEKDLIIDEDMIGLKYPEIQYKTIKENYKKRKFFSCFLDFLNQLQIKLLYLEKEINVTKLISFYTARTLYLEKKNVTYNDSKIEEYNDIINWLIIHKSTQLKGIASDKFLACKYVKKKLGKNLCPHRINVYNNVEEINFTNIIKAGNAILKVSNGYDDNIMITDENRENIEKIKNDLKYHFDKEHSLIIPSFSYLYSKKRIILEKMFIPITDLYEFKILIFNHDIKMIYLKYFKGKNNIGVSYYDKNFHSIKDTGNLDNVSKFNKTILNEMKYYAIKLSEDFPNFVRVDLYIFHGKIFFSELTFDSHAGMPKFKEIKYFNEGVKTWKRIDY